MPYIYKTQQEGSTSDEATTALRLKNPRRIELDGEVAGFALFDGSKDITIEAEVSALSQSDIDDILAMEGEFVWP